MPLIPLPEEELSIQEEEEFNLELEEPYDGVLALMIGQSMTDLQEWLSSPFMTAFLLYVREQMGLFQQTLLDGTVEKEECTVPGFVYRSDEALRGGIAFMGELGSIGNILAEFIKEARESKLDTKEEE